MPIRSPLWSLPAPSKVTTTGEVPVEVGLSARSPAGSGQRKGSRTSGSDEEWGPRGCGPLTAPPPVFCTVKVRSSELPTGTLPKDRELGVTLIVGGGAVAVGVQRSAVLSLRLCVLKLTWVPPFGLT